MSFQGFNQCWRWSLKILEKCVKKMCIKYIHVHDLVIEMLASYLQISILDMWCWYCLLGVMS